MPGDQPVDQMPYLILTDGYGAVWSLISRIGLHVREERRRNCNNAATDHDDGGASAAIAQSFAESYRSTAT